MYEICALLARKKAPKPRKPSGPRIAVGVKCKVWGKNGVVESKHDTIAGAWNVRVSFPQGDRVSWFTREAIVLT